jgi:signal transduction histidine kinase
MRRACRRGNAVHIAARPGTGYDKSRSGVAGESDRGRAETGGRLSTLGNMTGRRWAGLASDHRTLDAVLVLVCLAMTALAAKTPWSPLPLPVVVASGVAGSLVLWYRRRWPVLAAALGAGAFALSGNPGPWFAGVYSGATYAPRRQMFGSAAAGWAGLTAYMWLAAGRFRPTDAVYAAVGTGLVVVAGVYLATRRELVTALRERAEGAETQRRLRDEQARAAERTRIAREMHDVLAHKVSLIALHAGALELGAGTDPARGRQAAALIRVTAREALHELRTVLGVLNGDSLLPPGRVSTLDAGEPFADIASLVDRSTRAGQRVELDDRVGALPAATARVVYRVAQEGLTNVHRYAPGATTAVTVERDGDGPVTITVHNTSGTGTPTDLPGSGTGLVGLAERIRLVGGSLDSGPDGRDGWRLRAAVPWLEHE